MIFAQVSINLRYWALRPQSLAKPFTGDGKIGLERLDVKLAIILGRLQCFVNTGESSQAGSDVDNLSLQRYYSPIMASQGNSVLLSAFWTKRKVAYLA